MDLFYDYLDYCENEKAVSPGDYGEIRKNVSSNDVVKLTEDCIDTHAHGSIQKMPLPNGGVAYVRHARSFITQ